MYQQSFSRADRTATIAGFDAVSAANGAFVTNGRTFVGWNTKADGTGETVEAGSEVTVPQGIAAYDLYAQWSLDEAHVSFSANGGTFAEDSVFKQRPDLFKVTTDERGGEVATLLQPAVVVDGQTIDDLLGALDSSASLDSLGITTSIKGRPDESAIATRPYYKLSPEESGWIIKYYNYWFTDASGSEAATFSGSTVVAGDTIYYLKWTPDVTQTVSADLGMDADLYGSDPALSSQVQSVRVGDEFSLTGLVDISSIRSQMDSIQEQFPDAASAPDRIALVDATSSFTATLTLPDGVDASGVSADTVKVEGLGDLFEASDVVVDGQTITVTFSLKDGFDNYKKLRDAVDAAGVPSASASEDDIGTEIRYTVGGLKARTSVANGTEMVVRGTVTGSFSSIASFNDDNKLFSFTWTGEQRDEGRDSAASEDSSIRYTLRAVSPLELGLDGDMRVNGDTQSQDAYPVVAGQDITLTGAVDTDPIKTQMKTIENDYEGVPHEEISVDIHKFWFEATLTLPQGLTAPTDLTVDDVTLNDFQGFKVTDVAVTEDGSEITVRFGLQDQITRYVDLENVVDNAGDADGWMSIDIPRVHVADDLQGGELLTAHGTLSGVFDATATHYSSRDFWFSWNATQWADGRDGTLDASSDEITVTVQTANRIQQGLPGDLLVGEDSQHTAVITVKPGQVLDYSGALQVTDIKDKMRQIESDMGQDEQDWPQIGVDIHDFWFTATLTVPDGIQVPSDLTAADVTLEDFGAFEVKDVAVDGQTIIIRMGLAPEITTYQELRDAVMGAGDWMRITVSGMTVASDVADGTVLTATATVNGHFSATATKPSGSVRTYDFAWNAFQWDDGRDFLASADDATIRLSVSVESEKSSSSNDGDESSSSTIDDGGSSSSDTDGDGSSSSVDDGGSSSSNADEEGSSSGNIDRASSSNDVIAGSSDVPAQTLRSTGSAKSSGIPRTDDQTDLGGALVVGFAGAAAIGIGAGVALASRRRKESARK